MPLNNRKRKCNFFLYVCHRLQIEVLITGYLLSIQRSSILRFFYLTFFENFHFVVKLIAFSYLYIYKSDYILWTTTTANFRILVHNDEINYEKEILWRKITKRFMADTLQCFNKLMFNSKILIFNVILVRNCKRHIRLFLTKPFIYNVLQYKYF